MVKEPEYVEDGMSWFDVEDTPIRGRPVWVKFKTGWMPTYLEDAWEMSDAFWFAEVSEWKYCQPTICFPEKVISPKEYDEGEG